MALKGTT